MARRSDFSREQLYELAIAAALQIIEADGFRALTARSVAKIIGYSPGTLYNLFENLDDLILHVNARTLERLHERLQSVSLSGDVDTDISELLDGYLSFINDNLALWHMLLNHAFPDGHEMPDWYDFKIDALLWLVEAALSPLFDEADDKGPANAARVLWAGLHGITALSETGKLRLVTRLTVREMAYSLVVNYIAGIRSRKDRGGK